MDLTEKVQNYRNLIDKPLTPFTIKHLIFIICVTWKHLLIELNNRWATIRALLISDLSYGCLEVIKDLLEFNFGQRLELEVYGGTDLNQDLPKHLDKDLIISTSPLPEIIHIPVISFNGDGTRRELKFFLQMINNIAIEKHRTKVAERLF